MSAAIKIFEQRIPNMPLCTDFFENGIYRRQRDEAFKKRFIQHNSSHFRGFLVFDVDEPDGAVTWLDAGLPPPTIIVQNPRNGHSHLIYAIVTPVYLKANNEKPIKFAASVEFAYRKALKGDPCYANFMTKTPFHDSWRTIIPDGSQAYELGYLSEFVKLPAKLPRRREAVGLGRNYSLFLDLRLWSYGAVREFWKPGGDKQWLSACLDMAQELNGQFNTPLPVSEVRATAKSVCRWVWREFTPANFRKVQRERGKIGNKKSAVVRSANAAAMAEEASKMLAGGMNKTEIAQVLGVHRNTVRNWLK